MSATATAAADQHRRTVTDEYRRTATDGHRRTQILRLCCSVFFCGFLINKGPWDRLDHNRPFVPGAPAKPESANFYPAATTKEEVQKWLDGLSGDSKPAATGFFTTIRRSDDSFVAMPYNIEYQGELA